MLVPLPRSQRRRGARGRRLRSIRATFVRASAEPLGFFGEYMTRFFGVRRPIDGFGFASRLVATWNPNLWGFGFLWDHGGTKNPNPLVLHGPKSWRKVNFNIQCIFEKIFEIEYSYAY
jgi:hypothetical protein